MVSNAQTIYMDHMMVIRNVPILIHADDYGETDNTCKEMLELMKAGHLDGISVITNMRDYDRYAQMFYKTIPQMPFLPLINVHINLVEGRSLDHDECLKWTWISLYKTSYHIPASDRDGYRMRYNEVYDSISSQIVLQLRKGKEFIEEAQRIAKENHIPYAEQKLRIDSHQHAHMIPIVRKALLQGIDKEKLSVDYIRNAHEPLMPFLRHKKTRNITGFIKNRILALCAPKVERYIEKNIGTPSYLCGVMMSGHMDAVRLITVIPDILDKCGRKGYGLEINLHPAMMLETEMTEEIPADAARSFYMSTDRHMEALTVRTIRAAIKETVSDTVQNE